MIRPIAPCFFTILILTPAIAGASDNVGVNEEEVDKSLIDSGSGWEGAVGFIYQYNIEQSELDGEAKSEITPAFDITYRRGKWSAGTGGLAYGPLSIDWAGNATYEFYTSTDESNALSGLTLTASLGPDPGRAANDPVEGLNKIASGTSFGLNSSYGVSDVLSIGIDIERSFSDSKSLLVSGGLNASIPLSERASLDLSATTSWANDEHMQAYYGVSTPQSDRTGLAEHSASSGLLSTGLEASFTYGLTEHWGLNFGASFSRLLGDAAISPLVSGDTDSSLFLGFGYQF